MSWLVYDVEIRHGIPDRDSDFEDDLVYAEGWADFAGMGVACVGCWDQESDRFHFFLGDELEEFRERVENNTLRVGFNNRRFDDSVLSAAGCDLPDAGCYDLLEALRTRAGRQALPGSSLRAVSHATLDAKDEGEPSSTMPGLWQRGRVWRVIGHCLEDVRLTRDLFRLVLEGEPIFTDKGEGGVLTLPEGLGW